MAMALTPPISNQADPFMVGGATIVGRRSLDRLTEAVRDAIQQANGTPAVTLRLLRFLASDAKAVSAVQRLPVLGTLLTRVARLMACRLAGRERLINSRD